MLARAAAGGAPLRAMRSASILTIFAPVAPRLDDGLASTLCEASPMAQFVWTAETPDRRRYNVFIAPPGSLLDAGGGPVPPLAEAVVRSLFTLVRSARRGWRVAVNETSGSGTLGRVVYRERVADEEAATRRAESLANEIESGRWDPAGSGNKRGP